MRTRPPITTIHAVSTSPLPPTRSLHPCPPQAAAPHCHPTHKHVHDLRLVVVERLEGGRAHSPGRLGARPWRRQQLRGPQRVGHALGGGGVACQQRDIVLATLRVRAVGGRTVTWGVVVAVKRRFRGVKGSACGRLADLRRECVGNTGEAAWSPVAGGRGLTGLCYASELGWEPSASSVMSHPPPWR